MFRGYYFCSRSSWQDQLEIFRVHLFSSHSVRISGSYMLCACAQINYLEIRKLVDERLALAPSVFSIILAEPRSDLWMKVWTTPCQ